MLSFGSYFYYIFLRLFLLVPFLYGCDFWVRRIIFRCFLEKQAGTVWTGFIWLTIGTSVGLFVTQQWTLRFHKVQGISWVAKELITSQEDPLQWVYQLVMVSEWASLKYHVCCVVYYCCTWNRMIWPPHIWNAKAVKAEWKVMLNKNGSFFPSPQVVTPLPSHIPQCKALYDFRMTNDDEEGCLTFNKVSGILLYCVVHSVISHCGSVVIVFPCVCFDTGVIKTFMHV